MHNSSTLPALGAIANSPWQIANVADARAEIAAVGQASREIAEARAEIEATVEASRYLADASAEIAALGQLVRLNPDLVRRVA